MKLNKKYSNKYTTTILWLLLILNSPFLIFNCEAQNYPVQLTTQLSPPFSGYLNDYIAPDNEQLKALILFTDFTKPSYNVKLKFKLSGQGITIESKPFYFSGPVNLQPGIPLQLSGTDLSDLLNPNNLNFSGISQADYNQRKVLPEGFYEICFTAYDYNNPSNIQVSQQSCTTVWMVLSDPPYLNMPACSTSVMVQNPQQVLFQWTPMNLASPNSAFNTEYEFSLYEVRPNGQNPNFIIQSLPPIYQVTTTQTSLLYGLTEPVLYTGMEYVWRVKAKDISGRDAFRNNGYSQICTFTYGNSLSNLDSSSITLNLQGQALTHRVMGLSWDSLNVFNAYKIEFKKAGSPNWYPMQTANSRCTIGTLEPGQTYEARVKGLSADGEGPWSNTVTVPLPNTPVIVCGQGGVNPISQNVRLLKTANTYMIWEVGQFDMVVTQLNNTQSQSGQYNGMGKIEMPFLGINLNCTFNNITVTEMMQVINGEVNVVTQGINSWVASWQNISDSLSNVFSDFSSTQDTTALINSIQQLCSTVTETGDSSYLNAFNEVFSDILNTSTNNNSSQNLFCSSNNDAVLSYLNSNPNSINNWQNNLNSINSSLAMVSGINCDINDNDNSDIEITLGAEYIAKAEEMVAKRYKLEQNQKYIWDELCSDLIVGFKYDNTLKKLFPTTLTFGQTQQTFCEFLQLLELIWQDHFIVQFLHSKPGWQIERNKIISAGSSSAKASAILARHNKARTEWFKWEIIGENLTEWFVGVVAFSDGGSPQKMLKKRTIKFTNANYNQVVDLTEELTVFTHGGENATVLTNARNIQGIATGQGIEITGKWLRGTERNAGLFPKQIADKLKNKTFANFNKFREAFWKEVAKDPILSKQFDTNTLQRMSNGLAPFTDISQQIGGMKNYVLHHKTPINQGGAVYDMDNLYIVTPKYHKEILNPAYHYGYGY